MCVVIGGGGWVGMCGVGEVCVCVVVRGVG